MNGVAVRTKRDAVCLLKRLKTDGKDVVIYEKNGTVFLLSIEGLPPYAGDYGVNIGWDTALYVMEYADLGSAEIEGSTQK